MDDVEWTLQQWTLNFVTQWNKFYACQRWNPHHIKTEGRMVNFWSKANFCLNNQCDTSVKLSWSSLWSQYFSDNIVILCETFFFGCQEWATGRSQQRASVWDPCTISPPLYRSLRCSTQPMGLRCILWVTMSRRINFLTQKCGLHVDLSGCERNC